MAARTYVLIFFFWAILTVITPTLIFLSDNSKLAFADSNREKISAEITRTRKMMRHSEEDSMKTLMGLVQMQAVASGAIAAPAPAPALETSVGVLEKGFIMYKTMVAQMLFEV